MSEPLPNYDRYKLAGPESEEPEHGPRCGCEDCEAARAADGEAEWERREGR